MQQWLKTEAGIEYPRVGGGYKAMRSFLLDTVEQAVAECDFVLLGGMTGTGKTEVLGQLRNALDLEGHANHRGSSFGKRATVQPSNIDFENRLAVDLLKKRAGGIEQFVVEDESRMIGSCALPLPLHKGMQTFAMVWLEDTVEGRVERILRDYVVDLCAEFIAVFGETGYVLFGERLTQSLANIHKRLGGERFQRLQAILQDALAEQTRSGAVDLHRVWIEGLLREYYDPMYAFQRESKGARIEGCRGAGSGGGVFARAWCVARLILACKKALNPARHLQNRRSNQTADHAHQHGQAGHGDQHPRVEVLAQHQQ